VLEPDGGDGAVPAVTEDDDLEQRFPSRSSHRGGSESGSDVCENKVGGVSGDVDAHCGTMDGTPADWPPEPRNLVAHPTSNEQQRVSRQRPPCLIIRHGSSPSATKVASSRAALAQHRPANASAQRLVALYPPRRLLGRDPRTRVLDPLPRPAQQMHQPSKRTAVRDIPQILCRRQQSRSRDCV
jgi:hypothetical protein